MKCETYTEDGVEFVEFDGERKSLGLNPERYPIQFRAYSQMHEIESTSELRDRTEAKTREFGLKWFDSSWTKDQNGWGKCASSAATYAVEKARHLRGQKRVELSDDYLYSLVNDGRDRGSTLGENMAAITNRGIARRALVKPGQIYRNKYQTRPADKDALRFRAHEAFAINSEQEMISALVNHCVVVIAIHVGRNWQRFDADGVLIGDRGMGNHSEHCDDIRYNSRKGRYEYRKHSSHGKRYGDGGFCWIHYGHLNVHSSHQKYAVPMAIDDPLANDEYIIDDEEEPASAKLIVTSSEFCSWCKKWDQNDRDRVQSAGVEVEPGDVPGLGVPRFRLTVGDTSVDKIGYWPAEQILKVVADAKTRQMVERVTI